MFDVTFAKNYQYCFSVLGLFQNVSQTIWLFTNYFASVSSFCEAHCEQYAQLSQQSQSQERLPFFLRMIAATTTPTTSATHKTMSSTSKNIFIFTPYTFVAVDFFLPLLPFTCSLPLLYKITSVVTVAITASQINNVHHHEPTV